MLHGFYGVLDDGSGDEVAEVVEMRTPIAILDLSPSFRRRLASDATVTAPPSASGPCVERCYAPYGMSHTNRATGGGGGR